ncbi:hypothetical protein V5799_010765 [Amblyomma americanum]|uniref:adenosine deaminase n=1 Tax=Amblyomma americanum TaxID=6943 RepID=A0AAQ4EIS0_AMBAM
MTRLLAEKLLSRKHTALHSVILTLLPRAGLFCTDRKLRRDGASFSLNTDNPAVTHTKLEEEYRLALELGLTPEDLLRCNRSAISASFLPDDEKWELLRKYDRLTSAETATA